MAKKPREIVVLASVYGVLGVQVGSAGKFLDSDFGSESLLAQLRENFCKAYIYIFSPCFVDATNAFTYY